VDPSSLHDAISNVIERWGFGLEVNIKHRGYTIKGQGQIHRRASHGVV